jgi:hypothetical protein
MPARSRLACRFFHPSRENSVGGSALTNEVSASSLGAENLVQKIIEVGRHPAVGGFGFSLHLPDDRDLRLLGATRLQLDHGAAGMKRLPSHGLRPLNKKN